MQIRAKTACSLLATLALTGGASVPARADLLSSLLPAGVPGYATQDGVTVQSRLHPELTPLGLRDGLWQFWPQLDQSVGYDSNVLPGHFHQPSWEIVSAPSLLINSDWSRNAVGAALSLQDTRYLSLPSQDRTDGTASVGGRLDIGEDQLGLNAAFLAEHEDRGEVGTLASDRPVAFKVVETTASYTATAGRWTIFPQVQISNWTYDNTTIDGVPTSQAYRDRLETQASLTIRYEWAPLRNILFVARALGQTYTETPTGQPSPDSVNTQLLGGIDYDDDAVWHWRVLIGGETVAYVSSAYSRQNNLIAEAAAGWAPTGLTTVTATVNREGADAAQQGVSGMMLTSARLTIDHEYLRNLLLQASAGLERADFFQGGHQSGSVFGVGCTWIMNRSMQMSVTYTQTDLHGTTSTALGLSGGYSRGLGLVTLRLRL